MRSITVQIQFLRMRNSYISKTRHFKEHNSCNLVIVLVKYTNTIYKIQISSPTIEIKYLLKCQGWICKYIWHMILIISENQCKKKMSDFFLFHPFIRLEPLCANIPVQKTINVYDYPNFCKQAP